MKAELGEIAPGDGRLRAVGRIALGALFVWAGAMKISAPRAFAATLSRFDLLPEWLLPVVAIGLPLMEIAAGTLTVLGRRGGLPAILGMLLAFVAFLGAAHLSGIDVDCGCFGPAETEAHGAVARTLVRNILLVAVTCWMMLPGRRAKATDPSSSQSSDTEANP